MRSYADALRALAGSAVLAGTLAGCGPAPSPVPLDVGVSEGPHAVHTPPPTYPDALSCNGVGGVVDLRVTIGADGSIAKVALEHSSGNGDLDKAAEDAVHAWVFKPAMRAGKPTEQTIAVPMTFHPPTERPQRCFALDEKAH